MTPRERILNDRPFSALWRLALPNMIASFIQSLMLVAEGWYIGGLGGQALAGIALVLPLLMLTLMLSAGAMGGAVGGAMARAVGADDMPRANTVLRLAILLALVIGGLNGLLLILFGWQIFIAMGGDGAILQFAEEYSAVLFPGIVLLWLTNMAAAAMRGTGHMIQPAIGLVLVVVVHFALVAGQRAMGYPLGVAGGAWALIGAFSAGLFYLVVVLTRPGRAIRLTLRGWTGMIGGRRILGAGLLAGSQSFLTIIYTMLATAVFARMGADWLAGRIRNWSTPGDVRRTVRLRDRWRLNGRDRDVVGRRPSGGRDPDGLDGRLLGGGNSGGSRHGIGDLAWSLDGAVH